MAVELRANRPAPYHRRRPARTVLYRAVVENLETYLALCREEAVDDDPVPAHVERERRQYLQCGILAWDFGRLHCDACGRDYRVAFSCKSRALYPSCTTRRMAETAAHRVDHVFPACPCVNGSCPCPSACARSSSASPPPSARCSTSSSGSSSRR